MKRIKPNSYYVSARTHHGITYYEFEHYEYIYDDGFSFDNYSISPNKIYFENASWSGKIAVEREAQIPIPAELYNDWDNLITETRERIVMMGKNNCRPMQGKPNIGDYLFYHYTKDEEDEYDYDFSYFYKIVDIGDDFYKVEDIIDVYKYNFGCNHTIRIEREDYEIERILKSQLVDESFINHISKITQELIAKLTKEIAEVIKSKHNNYENRY